MENTISAAPTKEHAARYLEVFQAARLIGEIMLENGAETYRVEDTVRRVLATTGFEQTEAFTTLTGITISMGDPSITPITSVQRVTNRTYHLGKIEMANEVSRRFVSGKITVDEAMEALENIQKGSYNYPLPIYLSICAVTCGTFAVLFGGNWKDLFATLLVGFFYGLATLVIHKIPVNRFLKDLASSFLIGLFALLFTHVLPIAEHPDLVIAGSIMHLVPGLAMTNAIRDSLYGDYLSGMAMAMESIITAVVIAGGAALLIHSFSGVTMVQAVSEHVVPWLYREDLGFFQPYLWVQMIASFLSALTFCIILKATPKHLLYCGLCGVCCWTLNLLLKNLGLGLFSAAFITTLATSFLSGFFAQTRKAPATIFFAATIINLVPGYGMYKFMYYMLEQDYAKAAVQGIETLELAAIIALAMAVHFSCQSIRNHILHRG